MKKTTVYLDDRLLEEAVKVSRLGSKRQTIEAGLRALLRQHRREALRKDLGTFDLDLSLKTLRRARLER